MKKIVINLKNIRRGCNNLFFEVEVWNKNPKNGKYSATNGILIPKAIFPIVEQTTIYKNIVNWNGKDWNAKQCDKFLEEFKEAVKKIKEIEKWD